MKNKICSICNIEKPIPSFEKYSRKCQECSHLTKCNTCNEVKLNSEYRKNCPNRCKKCDNKRTDKMKRANPTEAFKAKTKRAQERVKAKTPKSPRPKLSKEEALVRLKLRRSIHRIFKRWGINKFQDSYSYLGFTKQEFVEKFPEIPDGVDIDHKIPMSWFNRDAPISIIFHIENLQLLPKKENRSKNNHRNDVVDPEYLEIAKPYIREEYLLKIKI